MGRVQRTSPHTISVAKAQIAGIIPKSAGAYACILVPGKGVVRMSEKRKNRKNRRNTGTGRLGTLAVIVVAVAVIACWIGGMIGMHGSDDPVRSLATADPGLSLVKSLDVIDHVSTSEPFIHYTATAADGVTKSDYYVVTVDNAAASRWYLKPFFPPRQIRLGVLIDGDFTIQRVVSVSPARPLLWSRSYGAFLGSWARVNCLALVGNKEPFVFVTGAELALPVRTAFRNLASSLYIEKWGEPEYQRLLISEGLAGRKVGEPFPLFEATDGRGRTITTSSLMGRRTILVSSLPTCGSCFDATVKILGHLGESSSSWNIVLVVLADESLERSKLLVSNVPASTRVIYDPDKSLAASVDMDASPYVVLLDKDARVTYCDTGYETNPAFAAIDAMAGQ
jgi:hypothetical protein